MASKEKTIKICSFIVVLIFQILSISAGIMSVIFYLNYPQSIFIWQMVFFSTMLAAMTVELSKLLAELKIKSIEKDKKEND